MFDEKGYGQTSRPARWYIGGLLKHARRPSWRLRRRDEPIQRLPRPGYEAPVNLVYSQRNRSACALPVLKSPKAKRLSSGPPDPSCNRTWRSRRC
jgi:glutamine synthetase